MTVERKPLFPNVLVEVFSQGHLDAVFKEAERLGYNPIQSPSYRQFNAAPKPWTTIAHFGSKAELYIFTAFTKDEANEWHKLAAAGSTVYKDYLGAEFKHLRKVRIEYDKLNTVVESRDNQAVLAVLPRKKHEIAVAKPLSPVEYLQRGNVPTDLICAPYGSNEFPECVCQGVDENTRKTCRMVKAYGGTCGEPFAKLLKANQEDKDKAIWVRPKAENPIVTKVVRFLAVAGTKVVNAVKRVVKHLRGGL